MIFIYFIVLLGILGTDWRHLSGTKNEKILFACLMAAAATAGVLLKIVPTNFGLVG